MNPEPNPPQNAPRPGQGSRRLLLIVGVVLLGVCALLWLPAQQKESLVRKAETAVESEIKKGEREASKLEKEAVREGTRLEGEAVAEGEKLGHEAEEALRSAEKAAEAEAHKLEKEAEPYLEKAEAETRRLEHEAGEALANSAADTLSEARRILREMSDKSPPPVPAETVGSFNSALSDRKTPLQLDLFPDRPAPLFETKNNPYFGVADITPGFESLTGAWWQPQFFIFGYYRNGVQTLDTGVGKNSRITEWVNRLDLFANLNVTPTERLVLGVRPFDLQDSFSGYQFEPAPDQPLDAINGRITTLYFEGNFLSLFPALDSYKDNWLGVDFSIGRQLVQYQDGILLNDYLDMVGVTHPSMFWLGGSATTATFLYAWGNSHRTDFVKLNDADIFGWSLRNDYAATTVEANFFYTHDSLHEGGDGAYLGLSGIQRFGKINTSFRALGSKALDDNRTNKKAVRDGVLLFSQISTDQPGTQNIFYLNSFWAIGDFTSVSRSFESGGPLASTGLLYSSTQLGRFGAAINPFPSDSVGAAFGYQIFLDEWSSKQLVLEIGGSTRTWDNKYDAGMVTGQYQQAIGDHMVWVFGAVTGLHSTGDTLWGLRTEIDI
ncbi:MAG: hypothetical protein SFY92_10890, partial [Verrucomicrobiae bacterium]|nr:hypothetical protein [Verrucomicrobiae bacterium]